MEDFFDESAYEACNAAKIVEIFIAFVADKIHSQSSYSHTVVRKNSEQMQEKIHSRTVV